MQDGTLPPICRVALGDSGSGSTYGSVSWAPFQRASPGTAQEGPHAQHQRVQAWGHQQWGASLGKGYPRTPWGRTHGTGREQGCPGAGTGQDLSYHYRRLPSQPRHIPRTPARSNWREHSGRLAGSWESHGDSSGKLPTAGCQCQPQPASPGPAAAGSRQHVPLPQDRHRAHLCIAFCFPNQGHSVQPQYLSKLAKQPGWKLA